MMKRLSTFLLVLCMLASKSPTVAFAEIVDSGTCGKNLIWTLDEENTLTISGTGKMVDWNKYSPWYNTSIENIVIENGVTTIGNYAFRYLTSLKSITIPDSITSIGTFAFYQCYDLTNITIPDSVISIGMSAFADCRELTSITIPNSVTSIGGGAFNYCDNLISITIPNSVTYIGYATFQDCHRLASVKIPNGVTSIGERAFEDCGSLTSITIPESVTSIGSYAFAYCSSLTSITIPESVTSIGAYAFRGFSILSGIWVDENNPNYSSDSFGVLFDKNKTELIRAPRLLNGAYTIPNSVTIIGERAFEDCHSLTSITIPESLSSIGDFAFFGCDSLSSIAIPNSVSSIGKYVFCGCYNLTSITIPNSVTSIGSAAFSNCNSLINVYYKGIQEEWSKISIADFNEALTNATIYTIDNDTDTDVDIDTDNGVVISTDKTLFDLKTDGYSFSNSRDAFGYNSKSKIPLDTYKAVFGDKGDQLQKSDSTWGGNCLGMSATAVLFNEGVLSINDYMQKHVNLNMSAFTSIKKYVVSGKCYNYIDEDHEIRKLIERYQIWQNSIEGNAWVDTVAWQAANADAGQVKGNLREVLKDFDNYIIALYWKINGKRVGHSVVIDSNRPPVDRGGGWYRIYIYDPNNPYYEYFNGMQPDYCYNKALSRYVDVNVDTNHWMIDVGVSKDSTIKRVGYDDAGNYIEGCEIRVLDPFSLPTTFDGTAEWYYSEDNANTANLCCANATMYDETGNVIFQVVDNEIVYIHDSIEVETKTGLLDDDIINAYTLELPFEEFTIDFQSEGTAQVFNEEYAYGLVSDAAGSATVTTSDGITVNGEDGAVVDVVVEHLKEDNAFTSVNVVVENDGKNSSYIGLDENNNLNITNAANSFDATVYWDGQENEYLIKNVTASDVVNTDITEYAQETGEIIRVKHYDAYGNEKGKYTSVSDALAAVTEGQSLVLQADITEADVALLSGVTLDLNGYTLTTDSVLTYSSSAIIDTSEDASGLLKINDTDGNMISTDNAQLPVYDAEAGGYRFFEMDVEPCVVTGGNKYWFKIKAEKFAPLYELIQADAEVQIKVKMTWDGQTEDAYAAADLSFTKTWADRYNANEDIYITVTATEAECLENFKLIPIITSGGVEISGEEM